MASGDGAPIDPVKDVGIRADRADGIVIRNVKVRHAAEHDIYVLESDGYLLDRFKTFYAGEYGVLTFVEDHGLMQNCEAAGNGDSGLYPGAGADTGNQRDTSIYPEFRYSQEIRYCDSHHNASGYSGTDGNATHVDNNNFYDNALGFTTDVFTAPGHPGFPQDSDLVENNNFYSNNFNPYVPGSDVVPTVPVPVGTGLWIAGGNDNIVRNNHFYDNWRRGTMVFAVPDQVVCGPAGIDPTQLAGCNPTAVPPSTSYRNQFYGNVMGRSPDGTVQPNGTGDVADRPHRLLVGPVPGQHRQLLARQHRQGRHGGQRHQHAAGAAPAVRVRQHERRHGRPAAGAGAAQLPRRHRVRHVQPVRGSPRRPSRRPAGQHRTLRTGRSR